jgi:uncharacterized membrane protein YeaQ/YmgE (transglycosylase-associated protein family)
MGALIGWIIFGLIAGTIAKLLMPGKDPGGLIVTMLLGIGGALLGGFFGKILWGSTGVSDWSIASFAMAIGGAILLLVLYRLIMGGGVGRATTLETRREKGDIGRRDKWAA